MEGYRMFARSPLQVGDLVKVFGRGDDVEPWEVYDILTIHSARTGGIEILYKFDDGALTVPLSAIWCRVVDGEEIEIGDEQMVTQRVV